MEEIFSKEKIQEYLNETGHILVTDLPAYYRKTPITYSDVDGYMYSAKIKDIFDHRRRNIVHPKNLYSIYNINRYLVNSNIPFRCISSFYINNITDLEFVCDRCGSHVMKPWINIHRNDRDKQSRYHITCPNCDGRLESIHALVLKQIFKHYYQDTIEEERSCVNPSTGKVLPTDIVNHRLKIAIEIQSQWHDFPDQKVTDSYKKKFWLDKGYSFYDPDIRNYTVLEMCQLFFDIDELPDYINYEYSNKINIKKIQDFLNDGMPVLDIADKLGISEHRIYDALHSGKLYYPDNYRNACFIPIVQLDMCGKFIREFDSINEANRLYGFKVGGISRALSLGRHYSNGSYWYYKDEYDPDNVELESRFSKFTVPVDKYDLNGNLICSYGSVFDAAKDCGANNYQIYRVMKGERKSFEGFVYKESA